ncbi:unnamed protein product, partial [Amoebophrya sp. A25]
CIAQKDESFAALKDDLAARYEEASQRSREAYETSLKERDQQVNRLSSTDSASSGSHRLLEQQRERISSLEARAKEADDLFDALKVKLSTQRNEYEAEVGRLKIVVAKLEAKTLSSAGGLHGPSGPTSPGGEVPEKPELQAELEKMQLLLTSLKIEKDTLLSSKDGNEKRLQDLANSLSEEIKGLKETHETQLTAATANSDTQHQLIETLEDQLQHANRKWTETAAALEEMKEKCPAESHEDILSVSSPVVATEEVDRLNQQFETVRDERDQLRAQVSALERTVSSVISPPLPAGGPAVDRESEVLRLKTDLLESAKREGRLKIQLKEQEAEHRRSLSKTRASLLSCPREPPGLENEPCTTEASPPTPPPKKDDGLDTQSLVGSAPGGPSHFPDAAAPWDRASKSRIASSGAAPDRLLSSAGSGWALSGTEEHLDNRDGDGPWTTVGPRRGLAPAPPAARKLSSVMTGMGQNRWSVGPAFPQGSTPPSVLRTSAAPGGSGHSTSSTLASPPTGQQHGQVKHLVPTPPVPGASVGCDPTGSFPGADERHGVLLKGVGDEFRRAAKEAAAASAKEAVEALLPAVQMLNKRIDSITDTASVETGSGVSKKEDRRVVHALSPVRETDGSSASDSSADSSDEDQHRRTKKKKNRKNYSNRFGCKIPTGHKPLPPPPDGCSDFPTAHLPHFGTKDENNLSRREKREERAVLLDRTRVGGTGGDAVDGSHSLPVPAAGSHCSDETELSPLKPYVDPFRGFEARLWTRLQSASRHGRSNTGEQASQYDRARNEIRYLAKIRDRPNLSDPQKFCGGVDSPHLETLTCGRAIPVKEDTGSGSAPNSTSDMNLLSSPAYCVVRPESSAEWDRRRVACVESDLPRRWPRGYCLASLLGEAYTASFEENFLRMTSGAAATAPPPFEQIHVTATSDSWGKHQLYLDQLLERIRFYRSHNFRLGLISHLKCDSQEAKFAYTEAIRVIPFNDTTLEQYLVFEMVLATRSFIQYDVLLQEIQQEFYFELDTQKMMARTAMGEWADHYTQTEKKLRNVGYFSRDYRYGSNIFEARSAVFQPGFIVNLVSRTVQASTDGCLKTEGSLPSGGFVAPDLHEEVHSLSMSRVVQWCVNIAAVTRTMGLATHYLPPKGRKDRLFRGVETGDPDGVFDEPICPFNRINPHVHGWKGTSLDLLCTEVSAKEAVLSFQLRFGTDYAAAKIAGASDVDIHAMSLASVDSETDYLFIQRIVETHRSELAAKGNAKGVPKGKGNSKGAKGGKRGLPRESPNGVAKGSAENRNRASARPRPPVSRCGSTLHSSADHDTSDALSGFGRAAGTATLYQDRQCPDCKISHSYWVLSFSGSGGVQSLCPTAIHLLRARHNSKHNGSNLSCARIAGTSCPGDGLVVRAATVAAAGGAKAWLDERRNETVKQILQEIQLYNIALELAMKAASSPNVEGLKELCGPEDGASGFEWLLFYVIDSYGGWDDPTVPAAPANLAAAAALYYGYSPLQYFPQATDSGPAFSRSAPAGQEGLVGSVPPETSWYPGESACQPYSLSYSADLSQAEEPTGTGPVFQLGSGSCYSSVSGAQHFGVHVPAPIATPEIPSAPLSGLAPSEEPVGDAIARYLGTGYLSYQGGCPTLDPARNTPLDPTSPPVVLAAHLGLVSPPSQIQELEERQPPLPPLQNTRLGDVVQVDGIGTFTVPPGGPNDYMNGLSLSEDNPVIATVQAGSVLLYRPFLSEEFLAETVGPEIGNEQLGEDTPFPELPPFPSASDRVEDNLFDLPLSDHSGAGADIDAVETDLVSRSLAVRVVAARRVRRARDNFRVSLAATETADELVQRQVAPQDVAYCISLLGSVLPAVTDEDGFR